MDGKVIAICVFIVGVAVGLTPVIFYFIFGYFQQPETYIFVSIMLILFIISEVSLDGKTS